MFLETDILAKLRDILLELSVDEIKKIVDDDVIFSRGEDYYQRGYVLEVIQTEDNWVKARVEGRYMNSYEVDIYREEEDDILETNCSCPYIGTCKHIVATLLEISQGKELRTSVVFLKQNEIIEHLKTLSNSKLINLVMEFLPEKFKKEIISKRAILQESNIKIDKIVSNIEMDINNKELLYNSELFQDKISGYIEDLETLVNQNGDRVFKVIFDLATKIEDKQKEYFDFDMFTLEIMELIEKIEDNQKRIEIFIKFSEFCNSSDYINIDYNELETEYKKVLLE